MAESQVISQWLEQYRRHSEAVEASRDSQSVSFGMLAKYDSLAPEERRLIFPLLGKWLLSNDNRLRYDSAFIISRRCVHQMISDVKYALDAVEQKTGPEAHFEAANLRRIIGDLTTEM